MSEPAEWYTETVRTARKLFKCAECGGPIQPGQKYHNIALKGDGSFSEFKHHEFCWSLYIKMCDWLRSEAGLRDDEVPGIGELIDATAMEKHENDGTMPAWWPEGLPFTKAALRDAAIAAVAA